MKKIYKGIIEEGKETDAIYLRHKDNSAYTNACPLSERIQEDIDEYGCYLKVKYVIVEDNNKQTKYLEGIGEAEYDMDCSEGGGHFWLKSDCIFINDYDLSWELYNNKGKFCYLEIEYEKRPECFKLEKEDVEHNIILKGDESLIIHMNHNLELPNKPPLKMECELKT